MTRADQLARCYLEFGLFRPDSQGKIRQSNSQWTPLSGGYGHSGPNRWAAGSDFFIAIPTRIVPCWAFDLCCPQQCLGPGLPTLRWKLAPCNLTLMGQWIFWSCQALAIGYKQISIHWWCLRTHDWYIICPGFHPVCSLRTTSILLHQFWNGGHVLLVAILTWMGTSPWSWAEKSSGSFLSPSPPPKPHPHPTPQPHPQSPSPTFNRRSPSPLSSQGWLTWPSPATPEGAKEGCQRSTSAMWSHSWLASAPARGIKRYGVLWRGLPSGV